MSLELSGSLPIITAKSFFVGGGVELYGDKIDIQIPLSDFCALIEYVLENTDLERDIPEIQNGITVLTDDPRIALIEKIRNAKVVKGFNPNRTRLSINP
jgi:hypothetical protein